MHNRSPSVVLVEDNPDHAEMVMRLVPQSLDRVHITHLLDGEQAWSYFAALDDTGGPPARPIPRLVLLDLRLPKVDGLDILRRIKSSDRLRRIPVVILSTSDARGDINQACDLHANSYLVKPMDLGAFSDLVRSVVRYWLALNRSGAE